MTRLGFLGNQASNAADLNLIVQIVTLLLLLVGAYFARTGRRKDHGRLMRSALVIQFGALILWMGPSLVLNIGALTRFTFGPVVTVFHAFGGILALALAISASYHRRIGSLQLKWTMRSTFAVWASAAILGIGFYVYYYVI